MPGSLNAATMRSRLRSLADPRKAEVLKRFFRTGPGEYGNGDVFIGVVVPRIRALVKEFSGCPPGELRRLLVSAVHEERMLALLLLVDRFERGNDREKRAVYDLYLRNSRCVNNWDLVDVTAPKIVGRFLEERSRAPLHRLARSRSLWERRIAVVSTFHFIRQDDFGDTLRIVETLLPDGHDLIRKASGWMLREVGKRDRPVLEAFLRKHCRRMPRTTLRYAIERFPERLRRRYLERKA